MTDVFPTGYFAASRYLKDLPQTHEDTVAVVLGCGPVGICAIASAIYLTGGKARIFAVDFGSERLREAGKQGSMSSTSRKILFRKSRMLRLAVAQMS